jgi:SAM-dependent methyltransferase
MGDYSADLAYIHDAAFFFLAQAAAPHLLQLLEAQGIGSGRIVELGCGAGVLAEAVAAAGYEVWGVDQSAAMIDMARRRLPGATFGVAPVDSVVLPACVAVAAVGEVVSYVDQSTGQATHLPNLIRKAYSALSPGGVLLFDAAVPGRGAGAVGRHWEGEDWALLFDATEDTRTSRLTRRQTTFVREGDTFRRGHETHVLQLVPEAMIRELLAGAGFSVTTRRSYGEQSLPGGLVVFEAIKPAAEGS